MSRNEVKARVEEVKKVKRENRKRKKVIEAYQEMMNAGATGLHTVSKNSDEVKFELTRSDQIFLVVELYCHTYTFLIWICI